MCRHLRPEIYQPPRSTTRGPQQDKKGSRSEPLATHVSNLGDVLGARGDLDGAQAAFERALRIDEAAYGPGHP